MMIPIMRRTLATKITMMRSLRDQAITQQAHARLFAPGQHGPAI